MLQLVTRRTGELLTTIHHCKTTARGTGKEILTDYCSPLEDQGEYWLPALHHPWNSGNIDWSSLVNHCNPLSIHSLFFEILILLQHMQPSPLACHYRNSFLGLIRTKVGTECWVCQNDDLILSAGLICVHSDRRWTTPRCRSTRFTWVNNCPWTSAGTGGINAASGRVRIKSLFSHPPWTFRLHRDCVSPCLSVFAPQSSIQIHTTKQYQPAGICNLRPKSNVVFILIHWLRSHKIKPSVIVKLLSSPLSVVFPYILSILSRMLSCVVAFQMYGQNKYKTKVPPKDTSEMVPQAERHYGSYR